MTLDGSVPEKLLAELIEDSHALVVASLPRSRQAGLARGRAGAGRPAGVS